MPVFRSGPEQVPVGREPEYFEILSLDPDDSNELLWRGRKEKIFVGEDRHYPVGLGDCVATGMGHHHDFVRVEEPVRGMYFETTLEKKKWLGISGTIPTARHNPRGSLCRRYVTLKTMPGFSWQGEEK